MNANTRTYVIAFALAALTMFAAAGAQADELGARATWSQPTPMQVRGELLKWLAGQTLDATQRAKVDALWPAEMPTMSGTELLEQSAATFAIVDSRAAEVVKFCSGQKRKFAAPEFAILQDEAAPALVRGNLKLLFGRWLAQQELFDEALAQLEGLDVQQVVDPASLLFYQSVCHHRVLNKDQALPAIAKLLENEDTLPRRYASVAKLMEADLAPLKADSLDEIARLMDAIRVEMEHARAGKRVRQRQDDVITKLDKLIEELEKQRQQQQQQSQSPSGAPPSQPLPDSQAAGTRGDGKVPPKKIGSKADWGNLPPKEREEALQQIGKEFPSHFREVIEEYFHKLARDSEE
jgi:hypothetical protein